MPQGRRIRAEAARCRVLLLTALAAFFCVQLAGGAIVERFRPGIRHKLLEDRLAALRRQPSTPDLVFLGSSRFDLGLDANVLTSELRRSLDRPDFRAIGAAVPGSDFLVMEKILDEMDRIDMHPPTLVVEMVPFHLLDCNAWYNIDLYQVLTWSDIPEHLTEVVRSGQFGRLVASRLLPLVIHSDAILKNLCSPSLYVRETERCPVPIIDDADMARRMDPSGDTPADVERGHKGLESFARQYRRQTIGGTSKAAFERILTRCARHGTRVLLVGAPVTSAHREARAPIEDAYRKYMESVQARFGVSFVDCGAALPDALFADHHHLKRLAGTVVFSRYLAREVLAPWLDGRSPSIRLVSENLAR
ncbi:MAG TPA: hypothetical protein VHR72_14595 [Gemmataceae bacterium]|jgi:hypothetical protein|nr:hypothetical protein [Gemmataceae bacterium]